MFYQVKVLGPDGAVEKIISSDELSKIHWNNFQASESQNRYGGSGHNFSSKGKSIQAEKTNGFKRKNNHQKIIH